jgi:hypothetical protein
LILDDALDAVAVENRLTQSDFMVGRMLENLSHQKKGI